MNSQIICLGTNFDSPRHLYCRYQIGPFRRGQAITVGNSLRRILLGDLTGVAITSAKILGVSHEFSTLPGLRESTLEILFNLQGIVFRPQPSFKTLPIDGFIMATGPKIVLAKDLSLPDGLQVVDPQQYIATLGEGAILNMRVRIDQGVGYRLPGNHPPPPPNQGILAIDPIFMPVRQVNYKIEEIRQQGLLQEVLLLEVWTNGSITPRYAIHQALTLLMRLTMNLRRWSGGSFSDQLLRASVPLKPTTQQVLNSTNELPTIVPARVTTSQKGSSAILDQSIDVLELPLRAYNCLKKREIQTVRQLIEYSLEDLLLFRNFGRKSADDVVEILNRYGLKLRDNKEV